MVLAYPNTQKNRSQKAEKQHIKNNTCVLTSFYLENNPKLSVVKRGFHLFSHMK